MHLTGRVLGHVLQSRAVNSDCVSTLGNNLHTCSDYSCVTSPVALLHAELQKSRQLAYEVIPALVTQQHAGFLPWQADASLQDSLISTPLLPLLLFLPLPPRCVARPGSLLLAARAQGSSLPLLRPSPS